MPNLKIVSALVCAALAAGGGCVSTSTLAPTTLTPSSRGKVSASVAPDARTALTITVDRVPPLDPSLDTLVAWVKPVGGEQYVNVGQVRVDDEQRGRLRTTTPFQKFTLLVTAEAEAPVPQPSGNVILVGQVQRPTSFLPAVP